MIYSRKFVIAALLGILVLVSIILRFLEPSTFTSTTVGDQTPPETVASSTTIVELPEVTPPTTTAATTTEPILTPVAPQVKQVGCYVGGCSGQVCSDRTDVMSTCEWREEYACYRTAACERQSNGVCGWTETTELKNCLKAASVTEDTSLEIR